MKLISVKKHPPSSYQKVLNTKTFWVLPGITGAKRIFTILSWCFRKLTFDKRRSSEYGWRNGAGLLVKESCALFVKSVDFKRCNWAFQMNEFYYHFQLWKLIDKKHVQSSFVSQILRVPKRCRLSVCCVYAYHSKLFAVDLHECRTAFVLF